LSIALLSSCATLPREGERGEGALVDRNLSQGYLAPLDAPTRALVQGEPHLLWIDARGQIRYRGRGESRILSEESPLGSRISSPGLYADASGILACWRVKLTRPVEGVGKPGNKIILCRSSLDGGKTFGKTQRLNVGGGAFPPRVAGNGRGDLYGVWTDERVSTRYDLYFNVSHDGGRTWKAQDIRLDPGEPGESASGIPVLGAEGDEVRMAWVESWHGERAILFRRSTDRGETWGETVVVRKSQEQPFFGLHLVQGKRVLLYWYDHEGIRGAYSEDKGRSWQPIPPIAVGQEYVEIAVAQDPTGRVYLVFGEAPENKKEDLFVAVSEDGIRFTPPVRLDTNAAFRATSTLPEIVADARGNALVVWWEYRNFRPMLYLNRSTDGGKTWLKEDLLVATEGVRTSMHPRLLVDPEGGVWLLWVGYGEGDFTMEKGAIYLARNPLGSRIPEEQRADRQVARLRERVSQFWSDRLKSDWGGNYDLMDPFLRERMTREAYIGQQFKTIYHAFEIKDIKVEENSAQVTIRYTVEIPEIISFGRKWSAPKREEEITEEWIWVDGDWSRVYKDIMGGGLLQR
jgi:hypothetical protein